MILIKIREIFTVADSEGSFIEDSHDPWIKIPHPIIKNVFVLVGSR